MTYEEFLEKRGNDLLKQLKEREERNHEDLIEHAELMHNSALDSARQAEKLALAGERSAAALEAIFHLLRERLK